MPKSLIKAFLIFLVVVGVGLVPGNSKLLFGYGSGADTSGQFHQDVCENEAPLKVVLYEPNHPALPKTTAKGEVILNWLKLTANADKYTIAYGVQPGNYIYGLPDVGNVSSFTVGYLNPGTRYYFVVRGVNGCMPGPWSKEWSAVAPGGGGGGLTGTEVGSFSGGTDELKGKVPAASFKPLSGSPRPTVSPLPKTGGPLTGGGEAADGTQPLTFWQKLGNWLGGLFR